MLSYSLASPLISPKSSSAVLAILKLWLRCRHLGAVGRRPWQAVVAGGRGERPWQAVVAARRAAAAGGRGRPVLLENRELLLLICGIQLGARHNIVFGEPALEELEARHVSRGARRHR